MEKGLEKLGVSFMSVQSGLIATWESHASERVAPFLRRHEQKSIAVILVVCLLAIAPLRVLASIGLVIQAIVNFGASPNSRQHKDLGWVPFLGNGLSARQKLEGGPQALFELIKQNDFKNFDLQFPFIVPLVLVMDERDRTFMLKDNWTNFVKNVDGIGLAEILFELFGKSFFVSDGERWRHGRKSALHMFNAKSLRFRTEVVVVEMATKLVEIIREKAKTGEVFDLQAIFGAFTFDVICKICFGEDTNTLEAAASGTEAPFLVAFEKVQPLVIRRIMLPRPLWKAQRLFRSSEEVEMVGHLKVMNKYLDDVVKKQLRAGRRRSSTNASVASTSRTSTSQTSDSQNSTASRRSSTAKRNNSKSSRRISASSQDNSTSTTLKPRTVAEGGLLAMYIDYAKVTKQSQMLEPQYLRETILTLMTAGRDTVAVTLTNVFNQLDLNRECQELLEQESHALFPNNESVTLEQLKKASYADAVFNETIRFSPPAVLNFRYCKSDVVMPSGMKISKHSMCMIPINAIGRDPSMWGHNAHEFDPERWFSFNGGKHLDNIPENKLPAFWAGPRACVGKEVARVEAKTVILALAREFDIRVERPLNEDLVFNSLAAFREDGLPVTVSLRGVEKHSSSRRSTRKTHSGASTRSRQLFSL